MDNDLLQLKEARLVLERAHWKLRDLTSNTAKRYRSAMDKLDAKIIKTSLAIAEG